MFKKNVILGLMLTSTALSAVAESRFSVEGLLGSSDQEISVDDFSTSGDSLSAAVRGAFSFNDYIAIEAAYHNYGEADDKYIDEFDDTIKNTFSATALSVGIKASIPLNSAISLNGRLGMSLWDMEFEHTDSFSPGYVYSADDDGSDLYYGVGIQYDINSRIFVGAEYRVTEMDASLDDVEVDYDINNISVSFGVKF